MKALSFSLAALLISAVSAVPLPEDTTDERVSRSMLAGPRFLPSEGKKIVGGTRVTKPIPWMGSLSSKYGGLENHFCGATLISSEWVITAAHCMESNFYMSVKVAFGGLDRSDPSTWQQYLLSEMVCHPGWDFVSSANDICLLKLKGKTDLQPVLLNFAPDANVALNEKTNSRVHVMGWGLLHEEDAQAGAPSELYHTVLRVVDNPTCQKAYPEETIIQKQMCAEEPGKDTCQGDSGGPMISATGMYQVGIVSYGWGCDKGRPGVYTRISEYKDWIESITGPLPKAYPPGVENEIMSGMS